MKDRTLLILTALIEDFVESAIPVASKKLLLSEKFDISSATIRNEFAELEEIGLILSPHVSAGKIPTQKGYRFFVDELMNAPQEELRVRKIFEKHLAAYRLAKSKETLFDILRLIAQLSGNVAFLTIENDRTFYLGLSNVLMCPEFIHNPEKAAKIVEILEGRERFEKMLSSLDLNNTDEVKIFIGEENLLEEISSCAMLVTRFETSAVKGTLGILGPMRMQYGYNRALLKNAIEMLG